MKRKFLRSFDLNNITFNQKVKFFTKYKRIFKLNKSSNKLTPHNKYYLNRLNLNTFDSTYIFILRNIFTYYTNVDYYVNYNTLKLYIFTKTSFGDLYLTPFTNNSKLFNYNRFFEISPFSIKFNNHIYQLMGYKVSNIAYRGNIYIKTFGSYTIVLSLNIGGVISYILPSGCYKKKKLKFLFLGKNKNIRDIYFDFNYKRSKFYTVKVRGIAKNPVDHPNGGNSNTKGSFKTP